MINTLFLPQKKLNFYRFFSLFTFHGCYGVRDRAVPCLCCNASGTTGTTGTKACLLIHTVKIKYSGGRGSRLGDFED